MHEACRQTTDLGAASEVGVTNPLLEDLRRVDSELVDFELVRNNSRTNIRCVDSELAPLGKK